MNNSSNQAAVIQTGPGLVLSELFESHDTSQSQKTAFAKLLQAGVPSLRTERWRYTTLRKVFPSTLQRVKQSTGELPGHAGLENLKSAAIITILNGQVHGKVNASNAELDINEEATLLQSHKHNDAFIDNLNLAFVNKTLQLNINGIVDELLVLHFHHTLENTLHTQRLEISCSENSEVKVLLLHTSESGLNSSLIPVTTISSAANSRLEIIHLQDLAANTYQLGKTHFQLARDANAKFTQLELGGQLVRHDVVIDVLETGAEFIHSELLHGSEKQHHDTHLDIYHHAPHTQSTMQVKAVMDERSRGVFNGKIYVEKDAQQINANLNHDTLLLSQYAEINTKPELEIYADDVKCAHGATVGQLDDQALFYLRSRGIDPDEAEKILVAAFSRSTYLGLVPSELETWLDERLGFKV
jgi:Fe-S cluster assembly protein SufD